MEAERPLRPRKELTSMKPLTPNDAPLQVEAMGLPAVFSKVWHDEIPRVLVDWQTPKRFFEVRDRLVVRYPRIAHCIPLWECNRDHAYAFDAHSREFVLFYYYGDMEFEVVANSYQRFVAAYLVECVYAGETRLEEIATILEFKHLDRIRAFAQSEDIGQDPDELKKEFVESIPAER